MQGSVSLGKDVVDTLTYYMKSSLLQKHRRTLQIPPDKESERIKWTVQASSLGKGLRICQGPLGKFLKDYVLVLSTGIEAILDGILNSNQEDEKVQENKGTLFVDQLKIVLNDIHGFLKTADVEITQETETFTWLTLLKKISAKFQEASQNFVAERLDGDPAEIASVRKRLSQKLIMAIIIVESRYERRLCVEHHICQKEHECTIALAALLEQFQTATKAKAKEFMRFFYESLPDNFFFFMDEITTHEFQVVLSDLSYSKNPMTKDILLTVYKTIQARLETLETNAELAKGYDVILIHVIMSDMDYFYYNKRKVYPFDNFLGPFTGWMRIGGKLNMQVRHVIRDLGIKLSEYPKELIQKLENQARVFLELTVDPENT